jgi:nucleotide-binding universal stress UspA family protein
MFTRILVPLDGSARAGRALEVAAPLVRALEGTLILVRVVQPLLQPASTLPPALEVNSRILSEEVDEASAYLAQAAHDLEVTGLHPERMTLVGFPAEEILNAVHASQADVIILCSHGRTGLLRWVLGSVAQRVVHQASIPVLVLHEQGALPALDVQRPLRALVPLDGSWLAEAALGPAVTLVSALAPQGRGNVHLVQVVKPPLDEPQARVREVALLEAQDYLSRIAEQLKKGPLSTLQVQITWSAVADKDVAGTLVNVAQGGKAAQGAGSAGNFDVIAMGTHGRGGLRRWVMGSVTERVLSAARLPVLVVRPKEVVVTSRVDTSSSPRETTTHTQKGLQHA